MLLLNYTVSVQQFRTITTESIKVMLYSGDKLLSSRAYALTNQLGENRLDQPLVDIRRYEAPEYNLIFQPWSFIFADTCPAHNLIVEIVAS